MDRRFFLKGVAAAIAAIYAPIPFSQAIASTAVLARSLRLNLPSSGRLGFYVDYSERDSVGTHTFYVCRTHGTTGKVTVDYSTHGDPHTAESGTLTWEDGEADIKAFTVDVASKTAGEHRIYAQLSNPTGGAVLHFGAYTRAYGVVDDDTIAPESDAVFYDADATTNGNGSMNAPYNNIYDAIKNVGDKRYLYGRGTTVPDGTNTCQPGGQGKISCILAPSTRANEESRLYIRNWPGFKWIIDGGGTTNCGGFYTAVGPDYHSYRGIDFQNLDSSGEVNVNGFGIFYHYAEAIGINIELCTANNINGAIGNNNGAYMVWGVDGAKIWRCTSNNIQTAGDNLNTNTSGVYTYAGKNISVQRCEMSNSNSSIYHKRTAYLDTSTSARFNIFRTYDGVHYGAAGTTGVAHSYTIVQGNLFVGCSESGIDHWPGNNTTQLGEQHWWCCNVFDTCGSGERGAITFMQGYGAVIFNNIFLNCRKVWAEFTDMSKYKSGVLFADYNHEYGTTFLAQKYEWKGLNFSTAAALYKESAFAANDATGDPRFTNTEYGLSKSTSPCVGTGVSNTDKGIYLTGIERIGPFDTPRPARPSGIAVKM